MLDKVVKHRVDSVAELPSVQSYLSRIGANVVGMRTAKIQYKSNGYQKDAVVIKFSRTGEIFCSNDKFKPDANESADIKDDLDRCLWPNIQPLIRLDNATLPEQIINAKPRDVFTFRDIENKIVLIQIKADLPDGKHYFSWTFWDDGKWRCMNPDDALPLWGAERLKNASVVFVHEGAKAARYCHEMINIKTPEMLELLSNHPWAEHLQNATHVGWIGGANNPHLTDWSVFKKNNIRKVYIVADNDTAGRSAVPVISKGLDVTTFVVEFSQLWPTSFDLADEFPENMFVTNPNTGTKLYKGPPFEECVSNATWVTDEFPRPDGKGKFHVIRDCFKGLWYYVQDAKRFVCATEPTIIWDKDTLDSALVPFSHVAEPSRLINRNFNGTHFNLCYDPSTENVLVHYKGKPSVNTFVGSKIKPLQGSALPWFEYLEYMFPIESERYEIMRWCATLIARPDIKIGYGLLLVSQMQGIGKTTLGTFILPPLLGRHNCSTPSASMIVDTAFTSWLARKRLIVVDEIYQGQSWKAYNKLKAALTDREVMINEKNVKEYSTDNFGHFIACSNSYNPLRIEDDDRRWFYPKMTETPWPGHKFKEFRHWLTAAGLRIIMNWACNEFQNYIGEEERSPMTESKKLLIGDSRSEATTNMIDFIEEINSVSRPLAFGMKDVYFSVRPPPPAKNFETDRSLRTTLVQKGGVLFMKEHNKQVKINGQSQEVLINTVLEKMLTGDVEMDLKLIRSFMTTKSNFRQSQEKDFM